MDKRLLWILAGLVICQTTALNAEPPLGRRISEAKISRIKAGATTEKEATALLGEPSLKTVGADGKTMLLYNYYKTSDNPLSRIPIIDMMVTGQEVDQRILTIIIDREGKVEKCTSSER